MGAAVWQFMWLLDKITKVDSKGYGWVLGGKPILLKDLANCVTEDTVSRNLQRLKDEGYIEVIRTPHGLVIKVTKAKKRFGKNVESPPERIDINVESDSAKMSNHIRENVESNIRHYSKDNNSKTLPASTARTEIDQVFDVFYKAINPTINYGNTTSRASAKDLIHRYGLAKVLGMARYAVSIQDDRYAPTITTPYQLKEKLAQLAKYAKTHQVAIYEYGNNN